MQLESPLESVLAAAKIAHHHQTTVVLNPAPARELPMNCWRWWISLPLTKPKRKS
jgi:sugar/nucleoside kinase (ribokinase family)